MPQGAVEKLRGVAAPAAAVEGCRALLAARTLQDQQACVSKLVPIMAGDRALAGSVTEAMFLWFTGAQPALRTPFAARFHSNARTRAAQASPAHAGRSGGPSAD